MKLLINILLMAFTFYTNDGSNGRLYQDDWSEVGIGSNFTYYVAYNHENDIVYVCYTGSPKQIRGYKGSDGTLIYSKDVSVTIRPLFVDANGNVWAIDEPTDDNIRIYPSDLSTETVWTLGSSILGGIAFLCITWNSEYVYLIGNNATTTYLRKYALDNLNGGSYEWEVTANTGRVCDYCIVDKYDDVYVHDYNYSYKKFSKTDGSNEWTVGIYFYGCYCEETDSIFTQKYNEGTFRETDVDGVFMADSVDIGMYARSISPNVNETYLYGGYAIAGTGSTWVATRFLCHNWTTPEPIVDGKFESKHDNYFIGDSTGYIHSKLISGISREIYTSSDVQFAFKEQSAWGTAEADSSNVNGILTDGFGVNSQINFMDFFSGRLQRYKHYNDIQVNQKGVVYETEKFKTPAIKTQLDYFLHGIFQNVAEIPNGTNYQKTFNFPLTQPDFTGNEGKFFTVWAKQPVMNTSQKIDDSIFGELSLICSPENEGILWIDNISYLARNHTDLANPTGTVTYPDISEFFFYDLTKSQIDSTDLVLNNLKINIKNNAKRIGIDSGKFKTFCLPRYIVELEVQMLYDSLAQTLMGYAKDGTAVTFEFQWGTVDNDGYLNISGNAKISQAVNFDRQDLNYVNIYLYCCGEYGVTEPFQIVMINSEDRGWGADTIFQDTDDNIWQDTDDNIWQDY